MLYSRQVLHFFLILNFLLLGCSTNHKKTEIHKNFKNIQEDINKFAQIPHYRAYGNFFLVLKKIH